MNLEYEVWVRRDRHRQAETWCRENLGQRWSVVDNRDGIWCCFWAGFRSPEPGMYRYYFKNSEDALVFSLRWA